VGKRVGGRIDAFGLLEVLGGRIGRREAEQGPVVEIDLDFSCSSAPTGEPVPTVGANA
jgi:hypothetical protein